ncbi:MAG TPA: hypothetical protein VIK91_04540, partial [Nannocystis sp.]
MVWHNFARVSFSLLPCVALFACGDSTSASGTDAATATDTGTAGTSTTETGGTTAGTTGPGPTSGEPTSGEPTTGTTTDPTVGPTTDETSTTTGGPVCPYTPVEGNPNVGLEVIATGFDRPLMVRPDPTNPDRLFVAEQGGRIKILEPGQTTAPQESFLDIDVKNKMANEIGPEQGLLGFDFHP